jgi:predicted phosphodiesterase
VCISDTHDRHKNLIVPRGDVLVHAGDFTMTGTRSEVSRFCEWIRNQPHRYKVVVAGNHDVTMHESYYLQFWNRFHHYPEFPTEIREMVKKSCIFLEDSMVDIEGVRIYGSPWQPEFCNWAFNLPRGAPLRKKWDCIPSDVDVLVTHSPPYGHGDLVSGSRSEGCVDLLHTVQRRVRPEFHVFGHIHEGYGITTDGHTKFINASTCTEDYRPSNPPIVFDIRPQVQVDDVFQDYMW